MDLWEILIDALATRFKVFGPGVLTLSVPYL